MKSNDKTIVIVLILIAIIELLNIINTGKIEVSAVESDGIAEIIELKPSFSHINDDINNSLVIS